MQEGSGLAGCMQVWGITLPSRGYLFTAGHGAALPGPRYSPIHLPCVLCAQELLAKLLPHPILIDPGRSLGGHLLHPSLGFHILCTSGLSAVTALLSEVLGLA